MIAISVQKLKKYYLVPQKEPGFLKSLQFIIRRNYKKIKAVDEISFSISEGELIGFIGPNGAGKTTTLKCLSGLLYPDEGKIEVLGFNPYQRKENFLRRISLVMGQKNQLNWDLPAMESFKVLKEIYEIPDDEFQNSLNELASLLSAQNYLFSPVRKLSLGERMKCELIAALLHQPKVIFLDEPTLGLDVVAQKNMRDFIKTYNQKHKSTLILTSHYMEDVKELCKRVIMIDQGKIIYDGLLSEVVKKYATHKKITVLFSQDIDPKKLASLGTLEEYSFPRAVISSPRETIYLTASLLLQNFPVSDLNIEETSIEEIVRSIFQNKGV